MPQQRIDVHTHLIPPFWAEELKEHGGDPSGWGSPQWSPEQLLRFMDSESIAVSVLSLTAPGVEGWQGEDRIAMTRRVNDYGAGLAHANPGRFGYFATLPLPDVNTSVKEVHRSYDELHADGIALHSNYEGIYLSDPQLDPLWHELESRSATIFVHPTRPPMPVLPSAPSPLPDYPADTTRCALNLILNGHLRRFPSVRIILSHGGGFLPYAATRLAELGAFVNEQLSSDEIMTGVRSFFFDTALVAPSGIPSLVATVPLDHIVFGTDYPYASENVSKIFNANLEHRSGLNPEQLGSIDRAAVQLFTRFK